MTKNITLKAFARKDKEKPAEIRRAGFIPAVLYGKGIKNQNLKVRYLDFEKTLNTAGESSLFDLAVGDSKPLKIIIKDLQKDMIKDKFIHIDLCQVDMKKKITVDAPLALKGEAPAVKELGGTLVTNKDYLRIECLPSELISEIAVSVDNLKEFGDMIRAADIVLPEGVSLAGEADDVLVSIAAPRIEKAAKPEEAEQEKEAGGEAGKGEEKAKEGKKEGKQEEKPGK